MKRALVVIALVSLSGSAFAQNPPAPSPPATAPPAADAVKAATGPDLGEAAAGEVIYMRYCAACHGMTLKGDGPVASGLNKKPVDLTQLAKKNNGVFPFDKVAAMIRSRDAEGRMYSLVMVAEGAEPIHGHREILEPAEIGHAERLGGVGERVARVLAEKTGKDVRVVVLGHLLRGGSPTAFDRLAAMRFGSAAVRALDEGHSGVMVALGFPNVNYVALEEVAGRMKAVPLDSDTLQTGRDIGISFGD